MKSLPATAENDGVCARQIAFLSAFVLPIYKLTEVPSILAEFAKGDLLLPALLHYLLQAGLLALLLFALSKSETPLLVRMEEKLGKGALFVYAFYALFFLLTAILPLLDLEKFVYAVFYDTAPTLFSFLFFFILCAFVCTKGLKAIGRFSDMALVLFLAPFLALLVMSLVEADISNLLPLFESPAKQSVKAFSYTLPHFSDVILLLPLLGRLNYKKGDGKKIMGGYALGGVFTLLFLGVFYGVYSTIAPKQHYAFSKIAQYFPALTSIGRIDLLLVYVLCLVLFFYTCLPVFYSCGCISKVFCTKRKTWISAGVCFFAVLFVLFFNRRYNAIYALFTQKLSVLFVLFADLVPLFLIFFIKRKKPNA